MNEPKHHWIQGLMVCANDGKKTVAGKSLEKGLRTSSIRRDSPCGVRRDWQEYD